MNRKDFAVRLDKSGKGSTLRMGYMVMYRGKPVRGGGTAAGAKWFREWKADYQRYGESTIRDIVAGMGSRKDYERIAAIDAELEGR